MLCAKLRRAMVNPGREPLGGLVEADEAIIPFRTKNDPIVVPAGRSGVGKMLVAGAIEIDDGNPQRARLQVIEGLASRTFMLSYSMPSRLTPGWSPTTGLPTRTSPMSGTRRSRSAPWRRTSRCPGSIGCSQTLSVGG